MTEKCDVLVLGATGMLGNTVLRYFDSRAEYSVKGTNRGSSIPKGLSAVAHLMIGGVDTENHDSLVQLISKYRPSVVVNCVGLVKQLDASEEPLKCMPINSLLPHRLFQLCSSIHARLVHISTDCVFDGERGMYKETDWPNARDLYGRSKLLGEVVDSNAITLRTSIIGHELRQAHSLLEWFLLQQTKVNGFRKAIFSGLPTVELARVIHDYVIPFPKCNGLYHVSSEPINKFDLLNLIAQEYSMVIDINIADELIIDRSLDSSKFNAATGFRAKSWKEMLRVMREFG